MFFRQKVSSTTFKSLKNMNLWLIVSKTIFIFILNALFDFHVWGTNVTVIDQIGYLKKQNNNSVNSFTTQRYGRDYQRNINRTKTY